MGRFLVKADPETYGLADLEKDGKTTWDGVRNPVANRHLKEMQPGDAVLVYHSGDEKAVVGLAEVTAPARPDPSDGRFSVVDMRFVARAKTPVTLAQIKADKAFAELPLVRQGRLSVMPVDAASWALLVKRAGLEGAGA